MTVPAANLASNILAPQWGQRTCSSPSSSITGGRSILEVRWVEILFKGGPFGRGAVFIGFLRGYGFP